MFGSVEHLTKTSIISLMLGLSLGLIDIILFKIAFNLEYLIGSSIYYFYLEKLDRVFP